MSLERLPGSGNRAEKGQRPSPESVDSVAVERLKVGQMITISTDGGALVFKLIVTTVDLNGIFLESLPNYFPIIAAYFQEPVIEKGLPFRLFSAEGELKDWGMVDSIIFPDVKPSASEAEATVVDPEIKPKTAFAQIIESGSGVPVPSLKPDNFIRVYSDNLFLDVKVGQREGTGFAVNSIVGNVPSMPELSKPSEPSKYDLVLLDSFDDEDLPVLMVTNNETGEVKEIEIKHIKILKLV
jgi:hypothetical protein